MEARARLDKVRVDRLRLLKVKSCAPKPSRIAHSIPSMHDAPLQSRGCQLHGYPIGASSLRGPSLIQGGPLVLNTPCMHCQSTVFIITGLASIDHERRGVVRSESILKLERKSLQIPNPYTHVSGLNVYAKAPKVMVYPRKCPSGPAPSSQQSSITISSSRPLARIYNTIYNNITAAPTNPTSPAPMRAFPVAAAPSTTVLEGVALEETRVEERRVELSIVVDSPELVSVPVVVVSVFVLVAVPTSVVVAELDSSEEVVVTVSVEEATVVVSVSVAEVERDVAEEASVTSVSISKSVE